MVVALFAVSLAMIIGGVAAVMQGFPYVRLESGLAMVIAGANAASAGAVLLGLSALLHQIRSGGGIGAQRAAPEPWPHPEPDPHAAAFREPGLIEPPPPPAEPKSGFAGAAGLAGISLGLGKRPKAARTEPTVSPEIAAPTEPVEDDLFDALDEPAPAPEPPALRPSFEAAPAQPESKPAEEPRDPQVVGTYSSGANTYVMYSNGTIEADTPRGRFNFNSLDELKAFVQNGGESPERGAA